MGTQASAEAARAAANDIRRLVRALRDSASAAQRAVGVSGAQLYVLRQLAQVPGLSINELAARTLTHQSSVSVVAQRLVDAGLAGRRRGVDARRVELHLTAKGRRLLERAPEPFQERLLAALQRLPKAKGVRLAEGLTALVAELHLADAEPEMFLEEPADRRAKRR